MFKKALQIAVTLCLLIGGYAGYTRMFAVVAAVLGDDHSDSVDPFPEVDSKSARRANELAREAFGPYHYAAGKDLKLQYYEAARGYYLYAQNYEQLEGNKRLHIWPFALIWVSADGISHKTVTSDEAIIDLSQPFGMQSKPGTEPSHIVHARLFGNVLIRDDKGTREDREDDLRIGPLTAVEYDETKLQITSDSDIFLQDRDLTLTGIAMLLKLRRKVVPAEPGGGSGGSGFDIETAFVYNDIHIVANNVGSNGILPGTAKPEKTGQTPLDLRCQNEMRIDFPRPRAVVLIGPPDLDRPPAPTLAKFRTNVRVLRGTDKTDQLNSDTLELTLMPNPKPPEEELDPGELYDGPSLVASLTPPGTPSAEPESEMDPETGLAVAQAPVKAGGPLTDLKLRKAFAQGDAVWLQSEASGLVARCHELHYAKHDEDGKPDVTYLNGGSTKKLWVEKVDYETQASAAPGTIKSIMRLTSVDATIFDFGAGGTSKVVARGPGKTEERPARNASVARTVWFEDEMEMLTWRDGEGLIPPTPAPDAIRALKTAGPPPANGTLRRLITLTGVSKLVDHKSATTLDARRSIVAEFQALKSIADGKDGATEIKWLDAFEDAHLTAPSRTLTARDFLKAKFETLPGPPTPLTSSPPLGGPIASATAPASTPTSTDAPAEPPAETPSVAAAPDPAVDGRADRVWATILLGATEPGSQPGEMKSKGELKNAQLRGRVMVHQDPAPGKLLGSDASGEALDITGQGNGLMKFAVKAEEPPQASDPKTKLASNSKSKPRPPATLARVDFEGKIIESEDIIGLDQKLDFAWAQGAGIYYQMADRGLFDDKGLPSESVRSGSKPVGPNPKDRLVITWTDEMRFYGRSRNLDGQPAAKIEFRGTSKEVRTPDGRNGFRRGVEAKMTESLALSDSMDVYMDRIIVLNKDTRKPSEKGTEEPISNDAQIAMIDCRGQNILQPSGDLKYAGVDIINEKSYPDSGALKEKQRIQSQHVTYDKRTGAFEAPGPGTTWLYKRKGGDPKPGEKLSVLELTKVKYVDGMRGRFGVARDQVDNQARQAQFIGSAEAANATVSGKNSDIDFDRPTAKDYMFLSSDNLHVFTEPPTPMMPATRQLLNARGNAAARTIDSMVQADLITYDSASELIYAYGQDGKDVSLSKQDSPGQPPSNSRGKSLRFNKKTKESKLNDPSAISFTDIGSGIRIKSFAPDLGGTPKPPDPGKIQRTPMPKAGRNSNERKSFTGGQ